MRMFFYCPLCGDPGSDYGRVAVSPPLSEQGPAVRQGECRCSGGLAFGLFHLNIPQFVYATALGIFWGMVYVRHRSFILVVVLHMITNAIGSLLMPWLAFQVNGGETIGGSFILLMIVAGPVLLFRERRGFYAAMRDDTKESGKKNPSLIFNVGFFVYVLLVVAVVVGMATLVVN